MEERRAQKIVGLGGAVALLQLGVYLDNPVAWVAVFIAILMSLSYAVTAETGLPHPPKHVLPFNPESGLKDPLLFPDISSDPAVNSTWTAPSSDAGEIVRRLEAIERKLESWH